MPVVVVRMAGCETAVSEESCRRPLLTDAVAIALRHGQPVVALESSVLAQGLEPPHNRDAALRMSAAVVGTGAVPAIAGIVRGVPHLGLEPDDLERFLACGGVRKLSARDLGIAMALGIDGATTVAGTLALCALAGIEVFATGGIGGVHRGTTFDESADLVELSRSPVLVVCAGAKSILDLRATLERLETMGVPVVGCGTDEFPGFFSARTGLQLSFRLDEPAQIARAWRAHRSLGRSSAMLVVQPPPADFAIPSDVMETAIRDALNRAGVTGVSGHAVTPWLLARIRDSTAGRSVLTNVALLEANARLAGEIAVALKAVST